MSKQYCIKEDYNHRPEIKFFDDTPKKYNSDTWQKEVYELSEKYFLENEFSSVIDIGTGSAFKLMKHFKDYRTLGLDLPPTVKWLRETYPSKDWSDSFSPVADYDLLICSDVIEHVLDPDSLLDLIEECKSKIIIISTPAREKCKSKDGPPANTCHVREWTSEEFNQYISSRFIIKEHVLTGRNTQTVVCVDREK